MLTSVDMSRRAMPSPGLEVPPFGVVDGDSDGGSEGVEVEGTLPSGSEVVGVGIAAAGN